MKLDVDLQTPERVIFTTIPGGCTSHSPDWARWSIDDVVPIGLPSGRIGSATYENEYGGFLDYTLMDHIACPHVSGIWVTEMTSEFHEDYWGEIDCEFHVGVIVNISVIGVAEETQSVDYRPATYSEIREYLGYSRLKSLYWAVRTNIVSIDYKGNS